jgi:hypothetical protein
MAAVAQTSANNISPQRRRSVIHRVGTAELLLCAALPLPEAPAPRGWCGRPHRKLDPSQSLETGARGSLPASRLKKGCWCQARSREGAKWPPPLSLPSKSSCPALKNFLEQRHAGQQSCENAKEKALLFGQETENARDEHGGGNDGERGLNGGGMSGLDSGPQRRKGKRKEISTEPRSRPNAIQPSDPRWSHGLRVGCQRVQTLRQRQERIRLWRRETCSELMRCKLPALRSAPYCHRERDASGAVGVVWLPGSVADALCPRNRISLSDGCESGSLLLPVPLSPTTARVVVACGSVAVACKPALLLCCGRRAEQSTDRTGGCRACERERHTQRHGPTDPQHTQTPPTNTPRSLSESTSAEESVPPPPPSPRRLAVAGPLGVAWRGGGAWAGCVSHGPTRGRRNGQHAAAHDDAQNTETRTQSTRGRERGHRKGVRGSTVQGVSLGRAFRASPFRERASSSSASYLDAVSPCATRLHCSE